MSPFELAWKNPITFEQGCHRKGPMTFLLWFVYMSSLHLTREAPDYLANLFEHYLLIYETLFKIIVG